MAATAAAVTVAGLAACSSSSGGASGQATGPQTITVAVVDNPQMVDIQKLTPKGFAASHPNIKVKYVTLDENTLRDQVTKDVAAGGGQFDVVMIGPYEVPTWAKNKWIDDLTPYASKDKAYNVNVSSSRSGTVSASAASFTRPRSTVNRHSSCTARTCWPRQA